MKKLFYFVFAALLFTACSDDDDYTPQNKHRDFYVLNEGQGNASINHYKDGRWQLNVFQSNNGGETLGVTGTVAVYDDNAMYIVTKEAPFLTKVGLNNFVKKAALADDAIEDQACNFALIDKNRGVLTTQSCAYIVTLDPLAIGAEPFHDGGPMSVRGDVTVSGNYIFLLGTANADNAILIYDATTLEYVKSVGAAVTGFAKTPGAVWAANGDKLVKVNVTDLSSEEITIGDGCSVFYNQYVYTPTGLQASRKGDALYFANTHSVPTEWGSSEYGRDIYKYEIASKTATKIFSAPVQGENEYNIYGAGVNVDPRTGDLYLTYVEDGWGQHSLNTDIYVTDANGTQKNRIPYTSENETVFWFPSMLIFR